MAGRKKKRSTNVATRRKRSSAAKKGWETRRENEAAREQARKKRSAAAKKAVRARVERELQALRKAEHTRRSLAAKKGAATRKAKARATLAYQAMLSAYAAGAGAAEFGKLRTEAHAAKWELFEAVDDDQSRYVDILEQIADDLDTDWHIAYGPGGED